MDQRRKLDPLKEAWSADPQRQRFVRELKYAVTSACSECPTDSCLDLQTCEESMLIGQIVSICTEIDATAVDLESRPLTSAVFELFPDQSPNLVAFHGRPLLISFIRFSEQTRSTEKTPDGYGPPAVDVAGFQKALDEMDPAQRHAALQRMGISAGLRPPPRPLEKSQARKLMTSLLQNLRLISEQLAEAWKLHDARTYEEKLRATLPYVEDIFSPTMEKFGFSTGWPGSFLEVIRSVSAVSNRTGSIKIAAMLDEMDSLLTGQLHEPSIQADTNGTGEFRVRIRRSKEKEIDFNMRLKGKATGTQGGSLGAMGLLMPGTRASEYLAM
ncbi:unnamed protein product [Symbiodinium sp. CCMP2592]|nr:unnamed protein product [Symbiodinium sp. CCMP2592]